MLCSATAILAGSLKQDILCHDMFAATEFESQHCLLSLFHKRIAFE
jgi:hypothetical protein